MGFTIRTGGPADLPAVGELHAASRQSAYQNLFDGYRSEPTTAHWQARFPAETATHRLLIISSPAGASAGPRPKERSTGTEVLAASRQRDEAARPGAAIGFAYVGQGWLHAIHLHPDWHGRGAGRTLMLAARQALLDLGFDEASLWVVEGNDRACRFYEIDGWRRSGLTRESDLDGHPTRQLHYIRPLR